MGPGWRRHGKLWSYPCSPLWLPLIEQVPPLRHSTMQCRHGDGPPWMEPTETRSPNETSLILNVKVEYLVPGMGKLMPSMFATYVSEEVKSLDSHRSVEGTPTGPEYKGGDREDHIKGCTPQRQRPGPQRLVDCWNQLGRTQVNFPGD